MFRTAEAFLCPGAAVRLTANKPQFNASQGQLAVVKELPNDSDKFSTLYLAPPGVRPLPPCCPNTGSADYSNWNMIRVKYEPGVIRSCRNSNSCDSVVVRRIQYPVKTFVAATTHKCMGATIHELATQISLVDRTYSLWMREQLYVLVSRVRTLRNITIVGNKEDTIETIRLLVLQRRSQWDDLLANILNSNYTRVDSINQAQSHPLHVEIPSTAVGYIYLLQSYTQRSLFYIVSTCELIQRVREPNLGNGAENTRHPSRRPWALMSYITGFNTSPAAINQKGTTVQKTTATCLQRSSVQKPSQLSSCFYSVYCTIKYTRE